jgi:hypothetical protein
MIRCLLIGNIEHIRFFSELINRINYFAAPETFCLDNDEDALILPDMHNFDALILTNPINNAFNLLSEAIKGKVNIFFSDQPSITLSELQVLQKLHYEANNLLYPRIVELKHPLIEDFIVTSANYLLYRYNKEVKSKNQIREAMLNALSFITVLSPMQVKKIDINNIGSASDGKPLIKVRMKLFDSSIGYVIIKLGNNNEHNIMIESLNGNFSFNFTDNYLENTHGIRFSTEVADEKALTMKSLKDFALCIILNKKPLFSFYHYSLVFKLLKKIENILPNNS